MFLLLKHTLQDAIHLHALQAARLNAMGMHTGFKQHVSAKQTLVFVEQVKLAKHGSNDGQESEGAQNI